MIFEWQINERITIGNMARLRKKRFHLRSASVDWSAGKLARLLAAEATERQFDIGGPQRFFSTRRSLYPKTQAGLHIEVHLAGRRCACCLNVSRRWRNKSQ